MVLYSDGSTKAQLGVPDMKVPIQYALTYPDRWPAPHPRMDWTTAHNLTFEPPNTTRFPCLKLAYQALTHGGVATAVLNAANEAAVDLFLNKSIGYTDIPVLIENALEQDFSGYQESNLESIHAVDQLTRERVYSKSRH